jgi:hypothetical protein
MQQKYRSSQAIEIGAGTSNEDEKLTQERTHLNEPVLNGQTLNQHTTHQETGVKVCISLLGEVRVWLEMNGIQREFPIKSHRRQELLAYIATMAPERSMRVSSGRIITDVFEHTAPGADVANLRLLFQKHTQLLRKEINEVAQEAGFPKIKLFQHEKIDNSSTKWWLSEECSVVDLQALRRLNDQMEYAEEKAAEDPTNLDRICDQLIRLYQSCKGDYLEKHLMSDEFGDADWVRVPFTEYRDIYLRALWNAAILYHTISMRGDTLDKERYRSVKKAAIFYKTYALYYPRNRRYELNPRKSRRQSERALRGHLRMCRWLMDAQMADGTYSAYERLMAEEFPEWKPSANTIDILRLIRQHSGESVLNQDQLEPPEAKDE